MNLKKTIPLQTNWNIIFLAILAGIVAGFQIGKVPPSISYIQASLGGDLVTIGWVISIFNLMAVFLAIFIGIVSDRFGSRRLISFGLVMLILGAMSGSFADSISSLMMTRVISGLGLVSIAVASPRLIVLASESKDRSLALGIWGIYIPAGMALGMIISPLLLDVIGWRGLWRFDAGFVLVFLMVFLFGTRKVVALQKLASNQTIKIKEISQVIKHLGPWLLGFLFALYAVQYNAVMNWLPSFLEQALNYSASKAAFSAAIVVACNAVGNLLAAWFLHRGVQRWFLQFVSLVVMAICSLGIYPDFIDPQWKYPLVIIFSVVGGMLPAAILAASASASPSPEQLSTVNGVIVQCTSIGSLSGPPLMAMIVTSTGGWTDAWKLIVLCCFLGILCIGFIRHLEIKQSLV